MSGGPTRDRLRDGRWHLQHGPIDLVIDADGEPGAVARAGEGAWERFRTVLLELVAELPQLRTEVTRSGAGAGAVARRMVAATWPHRAEFVTPMAAVAGAVADEIIEAYRREDGIRRAYVNNGGDIALHLGPGQRYRVGLFSDLGRLQVPDLRRAAALDGDFGVDAASGVRGVATSGWRGRSFSMGIADSATVLAADAAAADAAATMVANAIDVHDPGIVRRPACTLDPDTDLGDRLVTVDVPRLDRAAAAAALDAGAARAHHLVASGLVWGAILALQGEFRVVGGCAAASRLPPLRAEEGARRPGGEAR